LGGKSDFAKGLVDVLPITNVSPFALKAAGEKFLLEDAVGAVGCIKSTKLTNGRKI